MCGLRPHAALVAAPADPKAPPLTDPALIAVHVTPRSGRDVVSGVRVDATGAAEVCVRVTAPPDGGKANEAVCKLVAGALGVPKTRVQVASGYTARRKRLSVDADPQLVDAWVASLPPC